MARRKLLTKAEVLELLSGRTFEIEAHEEKGTHPSMGPWVMTSWNVKSEDQEAQNLIDKTGACAVLFQIEGTIPLYGYTPLDMLTVYLSQTGEVQDARYG